VESTQNLMMPAYYLMVIAVIGLITGLSMKETANRPLKGATPAASDIQEAKEILGEHYDNIEHKIEDIDQEIADCRKNVLVWCSSIRASTTNRFALNAAAAGFPGGIFYARLCAGGRFDYATAAGCRGHR
jgi:MHS family proline/betaine transporter-like MFS transporter